MHIAGNDVMNVLEYKTPRSPGELFTPEPP